MIDAAAEGDTATLAHEAHTLRGGSGGLGAARMAERCSRIQAAVTRGALDEAREEVGALPAELEAAVAALRARLDHLAGAAEERSETA